MYRITLNGFDPESDLIDSEAATQSLTLEDRAALVAFLDRFQHAKQKEEGLVGRAMIYGPGVDVEVRSDEGALYLYDRNDPNRQGVPVSPQSFAEGSAEEPEPETTPIRLKERQKTGQMMKILAAAILVTVAIQAVFFFSTQDTGPYGEEKTRPVAAAEATRVVTEFSGFYAGGPEENPLAVLIEDSGRYQFYERLRQDRWIAAEEGALQVVDLGDVRALELEDSSVFVILSTGILDYYGYQLARLSEIPNLEQP